MLTAALFNCSIDDRELQVTTPGLLGSGGGTGVGPGSGDGSARLAVSTSAVDFGNITVGFPARTRITLRNDGVAALSAPTVARSSDSSADFQIVQNQCGSELAAGASCDVRVQFVPSAAGVGQARLDVGSANGGSLAVALAGQGMVGGDLILAPALGSFENFGDVDLGASVQGKFTISNPRADSSGPLTFTVNRPELTVLPAVAGDCTPGVTPLANGQGCDIQVAFSPLERGLTEGTLTATSPAGGSVSLTLSGRGLQAGTLSASSETLDFGGVVLLSSGLGSLRFENVGDKPLTLGGARLEPPEATQFSIQSSDCATGMSLLGGTSCGVQLQYRPSEIDVENTADLVLEVAGGAPLRLPLVGRGLQPGALQLTATDATSGPDFGDVLVGDAQTRTFTVLNPGNQASGVLSLIATGGFEVVSPPEGTDCIDGTTSLATAESCTVRVSLAPLDRQLLSGALTISSALAGAISLPLSARGVIDASFEVEPQVDFGRVLTGASATRTITIGNAGDRALAVPSVEVTSDDAAQKSAFTFDNGCSAPLATGETCDVVVTWVPTEAVPHSANLKLVADPGGTATVLLVGQALSPGSLQLTVAEAAGPDFGDVPLGTTATRTFVLTNPGNEASGRITVSSDDNHFLPSLGDCNQGPPEGLVDGASCTFSVVFTPDSSDALVANLSVQSPGAGRTGVELHGQGRAGATLSATGNRDLGRARIGQGALAAQPENSFDWTVSNDGDLATGALRVQPSNGTEFPISADTCTGTALAGHATCQMTIRFVPSAPAGMRQATVSVTDPTSSSVATVALTGLAVSVAQPGGSCVNGEECAAGVCTGGVCCDRACDSTCQACSATGVCVDQSNQEPCGTGGARCFGVDECKLPADAACGGNADCGGGLLCKTCTTGGSRCTAPEACCGACPGSTTCQGGTCGCSATQVDCGGNLCIPTNRADVCCPVSPSCPSNVPACRSDGQCVQCLVNTDCGSCGTCNTATNTCQTVAAGQRGNCTFGQVCTANGTCTTPQCDGVGDCGDCNSCDTNTFTCFRAGLLAPCSTGVCNANGQCVQCVNNDQCPGQMCQNSQCVPLPVQQPPAQPPAQQQPPQQPPAQDPPAATQTRCESIGGVGGDTVCCEAACGTCGGSGCSGLPGGSSNCCTGTIQAQGRICSRDRPPCTFADADPDCNDGIIAGTTCCSLECGTCGGSGCGSRPGGAAECCGEGIQASGRTCENSRAPCIYTP